MVDSIKPTKVRRTTASVTGERAPEGRLPGIVYDPEKTHADAFEVLDTLSPRATASPNYRILSDHGPGFPHFHLERGRKSGHPVLPWTVDDPEQMMSLILKGVAGLITDAP